MSTLLARMDAIPAVLIDRLGETLAYSAAYERLARPIGLLDGDRQSRTRFVFTDHADELAWARFGRSTPPNPAPSRTGLSAELI